jgi:hypothetical protein
LQQQVLGTLDAAAYCAIVFSFVFGAPLLLIPFATLCILPTYDLTLVQALKNSVVIIANTPIYMTITGVLSAIPLLLLIPGMVFSIVVYVLMMLFGCGFVALAWIAAGERGMLYCKALKAYEARKNAVIMGKTKKQKGQKEITAYQGNPTDNRNKKQAKPQQQFVNPKKKKKK